LDEIGAKDKPEMLLLNKIDTPEGDENFPEWRTLYPDAIPLSAKTGKGIDRLYAAVAAHVNAQQVQAVLEADSSNGKLLAFIETHCQVRDRQFDGDRIIIHATMSKRALADLSRNEQVMVKSAE
jgi:GTP-binding protein HflX